MQRTTAQAVADSTFYVVEFETAIYDTHGMWKSSTPTELRPAYSGLYTCIFNITQVDNEPATLEYLVNGVRQLVFRASGVPLAGNAWQCVAPLELGLNDVIQVQWRPSGGAGGNTLSNANLHMHRAGI